MFINFLHATFLLTLLLLSSGCSENTKETSASKSSHKTLSVTSSQSSEPAHLSSGIPKIETTRPAPTVQSMPTTGHLVDASGVEGLSYRCDTKALVTLEQGSYFCESLPITFYLGHLELGKLSALPSDLTIYSTDLLNQPRGALRHPDVIKVSMLLQSLDEDGDSSNGILITQETLQISDNYFNIGEDIRSLSMDELRNRINAIINDRTQQTSPGALHFVDQSDAPDNLTASVARLVVK